MCLYVHSSEVYWGGGGGIPLRLSGWLGLVSLHTSHISKSHETYSFGLSD